MRSQKDNDIFISRISAKKDSWRWSSCSTSLKHNFSQRERNKLNNYASFLTYGIKTKKMLSDWSLLKVITQMC